MKTSCFSLSYIVFIFISFTGSHFVLWRYHLSNLFHCPEPFHFCLIPSVCLSLFLTHIYISPLVLCYHFLSSSLFLSFFLSLSITRSTHPWCSLILSDKNSFIFFSSFLCFNNPVSIFYVSIPVLLFVTHKKLYIWYSVILFCFFLHTIQYFFRLH